jgi:hypothetical protein
VPERPLTPASSAPLPCRAAGFERARPMGFAPRERASRVGARYTGCLYSGVPRFALHPQTPGRGFESRSARIDSKPTNCLDRERGCNGRDGGIRTRDPLNPIQVRYQAAPRPDRKRVGGAAVSRWPRERGAIRGCAGCITRSRARSTMGRSLFVVDETGLLERLFPRAKSRGMVVKGSTRTGFTRPVLEALRGAKMLAIRSGRPHRYLGIWVVVVKDRVFVRPWNDKPDGWRRAFLEKPQGASSCRTGERSTFARGPCAGSGCGTRWTRCTEKSIRRPARGDGSSVSRSRRAARRRWSCGLAEVAARVRLRAILVWLAGEEREDLLQLRDRHRDAAIGGGSGRGRGAR